ncbi:MAG: hypothetical protein WCC62_02000 [Pseudomonas capeferrum]
MSSVYEKQLHGRLWLISDAVRYPVCVNEEGYLQVVFSDVEGEDFTIGMLAHPQIGGEMAFEFRTAAGRQITGAGKDVLREASEEMPVPGPVLRIVREDIEFEGYPNLHKVKLQTLDTRFVSANERVVVGKKRRVKAWSWWSVVPYEYVNEYGTRLSDLLRMMEPSEVAPSEFLLELIESDA